MLKAYPESAETPVVKCQRLVVEMGEDIFSLDLHPRLTVLSGLGATERATLAAELYGALSGDRSGVHLEVRDAVERKLAVLRPRGGRHRVIDVDRELDVTHEFAGAGGDVDLVSRAGFGSAAVNRLVVEHLLPAPERVFDPRELELARIEQKTLWGAAENVRRTGRALGAMAASANAVMSEQRLVDEVETAHRRLETSHQRMAKAEVIGARVALAAAGLSIPMLGALPPAAIVLLAVSTASMGWSTASQRTSVKAQDLEEEALRLAGAQSYLGFHLQRVNGMLSSAETRRRLSTAADLHRRALAEWNGVAGEIGVDWAFDHQGAILSTALVEHAMCAQPQLLTPTDRPIASTLATLLTDTPAGHDDDILPLICDEPLKGHDAGSVRRIMGQLSRWAGLRQVIVFTGDPVVRDWAAAEATLGRVHLVEATPLDSAEPFERATIDLSLT